MIHKYKIKVVASDDTILSSTEIHLSNGMNREEAYVLPLVGFREEASYHEIKKCPKCEGWYAKDLFTKYGSYTLCQLCFEKEGEEEEDEDVSK